MCIVAVKRNVTGGKLFIGFFLILLGSLALSKGNVFGWIQMLLGSGLVYSAFSTIRKDQNYEQTVHRVIDPPDQD